MNVKIANNFRQAKNAKKVGIVLRPLEGVVRLNNVGRFTGGDDGKNAEKARDVEPLAWHRRGMWKGFLSEQEHRRHKLKKQQNYATI